jgi:hypothetical protein
MASQRGKDWKTDAQSECVGKQGFATGHAANTAVKQMGRRYHGRRINSLKTYRCDLCGSWHIGHPPKLVRRDQAKARIAESRPES